MKQHYWILVPVNICFFCKINTKKHYFCYNTLLQEVILEIFQQNLHEGLNCRPGIFSQPSCRLAVQSIRQFAFNFHNFTARAMNHRSKRGQHRRSPETATRQHAMGSSNTVSTEACMTLFRTNRNRYQELVLLNIK